MQTIEVQTSQNVNIEYPVASIGDRVAAGAIDYLIMIGYLVAMILIFSVLLEATRGSDFYYPAAYFIILFLPLFFYHFLCETFLNGQSFGKKIMKTRVVKLDGTQAGIGSYFLRWLIAPIDIYMTYGSVGIITMLINGKGQRLGDLAAGTTVVKLKTAVKLEDTILKVTPQDYQVRFPQVKLLTDKDIAVVKEVIDMGFKFPDVMTYEKILSKTKTVIEKKTGIESTHRARTFLDIVLKDYNFLNNE